MVRVFLITLLISGICFCSGCANKEAEKDYMVSVDYEGLVYPSNMDGKIMLGQQFFETNPIYICATANGSVSYFTENSEINMLDDVDEKYITGSRWSFDDENIIITKDNELFIWTLEGQEICSIRFDGMIVDFTKLANERLAVATYTESNSTSTLEIVAITDGTIKMSLPLDLTPILLSSNLQSDLIITNTDGIFLYDTNTLEKTWYLKWLGISFPINSATISDMVILSDTNLQLLQANNIIATLSKIESTSVDKIVLEYKTTALSDPMKKEIVQFNVENENYYINITECGSTTSYSDYRDKINVEIAAGHGPDILDSQILEVQNDYIEKGILEDLTPYISNSSMKPTNYVEGTFSSWSNGDACYGIGIGFGFSSIAYVPKKIANSMEDWTLNSWTKVLALEDGDKYLFQAYNAENVLRFCIKSSGLLESFMDKENGKCNFTNTQWYDVLEFAKLYGYTDAKAEFKEMAKIVTWNNFCNYSGYDNTMEAIEYVPVGVPCESGKTLSIYFNTVGMNGNSDYKEGVWEFLEFLLRRETQTKLYTDQLSTSFPSQLESFNDTADYFFNHPELVGRNFTIMGVDGDTKELTSMQVEEVNQFMESALPEENINTDIYSIIYEESQYYFNDTKSVEKVSEIIQNRVQLYMNENR